MTKWTVSLNTAYDVGQLSISHRRGAITLLPKDDAPLTHYFTELETNSAIECRLQNRIKSYR